jgi:hypothetical protein
LTLKICEHSRIKILQLILTKLGTYVVLRRVWNPIDFQEFPDSFFVISSINPAVLPFSVSTYIIFYFPTFFLSIKNQIFNIKMLW